MIIGQQLYLGNTVGGIATIGDGDGFIEGSSVGSTDIGGNVLGLKDGFLVGCVVGFSVGRRVGRCVEGLCEAFCRINDILVVALVGCWEIGGHEPEVRLRN